MCLFGKGFIFCPLLLNLCADSSQVLEDAAEQREEREHSRYYPRTYYQQQANDQRK